MLRNDAPLIIEQTFTSPNCEAIETMITKQWKLACVDGYFFLVIHLLRELFMDYFHSVVHFIWNKVWLISPFSQCCMANILRPQNFKIKWFDVLLSGLVLYNFINNFSHFNGQCQSDNCLWLHFPKAIPTRPCWCYAQSCKEKLSYLTYHSF